MRSRIPNCISLLIAGAIALICYVSSPASAQQLNALPATVSIQATLPETFTVSATPATLAITLVPGKVNVGSTPINITSSWSLQANRGTVSLFGYFSSATAALTDGNRNFTNNIASSLILGQITTGTPTTYTPFKQSGVGTAGAALNLFSQTVGTTAYVATRTDVLNLEVDLTTLPQLPAAVYAGTLTLQAQAF